MTDDDLFARFRAEAAVIRATLGEGSSGSERDRRRPARHTRDEKIRAVLARQWVEAGRLFFPRGWPGIPHESRYPAVVDDVRTVDEIDAGVLVPALPCAVDVVDGRAPLLVRF